MKLEKESKCPNCYSKLIKYIGYINDGVNIHLHFDCMNCGFSWEENAIKAENQSYHDNEEGMS